VKTLSQNPQINAKRSFKYTYLKWKTGKEQQYKRREDLFGVKLFINKVLLQFHFQIEMIYGKQTEVWCFSGCI
jgi:hypothetical protein